MRGSNNLGDSRPGQTRLQRQAGASRQANILSLSVTHNKSPFRKNRKITKKGEGSQARPGTQKEHNHFPSAHIFQIKKKKRYKFSRLAFKKGPTQKKKIQTGK